MLKKAGFYLIILNIIFSCNLYKDPSNTEQLSQESLPEDFVVPDYWSSSVNDSLPVIADWYKEFESTALDSLIQESLDSTNIPVLLQLTKIDFAKASVDLASSGRKPQLNYGGLYEGYTAMNTTDTYTVGAGLIASWEVDLWGRIKAGVLSSDESLNAAMYAYDFTRLSIAARVCNLYFTLGALNDRLKIGAEFLELNQRIFKLLKVREDIGMIDAQSVRLTEAQIASIQATLTRYENTRQNIARELELSIGRYPSDEIEVNFNFDKDLPIVSVEDPLSVISRRPDLKALEANVRRQFYLSEQVRLTKYPNLVLSASPGFSNVGTLVLGSGASLLGPIFNGGAIDARLNQATAIQKQAALSYGLGIMNAFQEIESTMQTEQILKQREVYVKAMIEKLKSAFELTVEGYKVGKKDLFQVLQIQSQWLLSELDLIAVRELEFKNRVKLYRVLGGNINEQIDYE